MTPGVRHPDLEAAAQIAEDRDADLALRAMASDLADQERPTLIATAYTVKGRWAKVLLTSDDDDQWSARCLMADSLLVALDGYPEVKTKGTFPHWKAAMDWSGELVMLLDRLGDEVAAATKRVLGADL